MVCNGPMVCDGRCGEWSDVGVLVLSPLQMNQTEHWKSPFTPFCFLFGFRGWRASVFLGKCRNTKKYQRNTNHQGGTAKKKEIIARRYCTIDKVFDSPSLASLWFRQQVLLWRKDISCRIHSLELYATVACPLRGFEYSRKSELWDAPWFPQ